MANNFFLNQDPLLFQNCNHVNDDDVRRQLAEALNQYQQMQQRGGYDMQQYQNDHISELDKLMSGVSDSVLEKLKSDDEYNRLNAELQLIINREILMSIRGKINGNQDAVKNILRQKEIISKLKSECESEERKSLSELNDYIKNYSNLTFDEYKRKKTNAEPQNGVE